MLGKAGNIGKCIGSDRRVVLEVVLEGQRVFAGGVVVEVGHGLVAGEIGGARNEGVER